MNSEGMAAPLKTKLVPSRPSMSFMNNRLIYTPKEAMKGEVVCLLSQA